MRRHQRGSIYKRSGSWWVRYYDGGLTDDGKPRRPQVCLGSIAELPTKTEAKRRAEQVLRMVNLDGPTEYVAGMTLGRYWESRYLPWATVALRTSTVRGYVSAWKSNLEAPLGKRMLHEFRPALGQNLLDSLAARGLGRRSVAHVKHLLSGIFTRAIQEGLLVGGNPMLNVALPKGEMSLPTHAANINDVMAMLDVLPAREAAAVGIAALAGLRKGEIAGLTWEDYDGEMIEVRRSVWNGRIGQPKSGSSRAAVPVIPHLAVVLESYRVAQREEREKLAPEKQEAAKSPWMFPGGKPKQPADLNAMVRRHISAALKKNEMQWHGWHSFRRGLGTVLSELGVDVKTIQQILRHSNIAVTAKHYIKPSQEKARTAMGLLDARMKKGAVQ